MDNLDTNAGGWTLSAIVFAGAAIALLYGLGNLMAQVQALDVDATTILADGLRSLMNRFI
mgnify:FL=1